MTRVLIIEDEWPLAEALKVQLQQLPEEIEVISVIHSVKMGIEYLSQKDLNIDLIFADIELGDGLSFEIFHQTNCETAVIFTTAYNQYAIDAFKINSIDYLLKPIDNEELEIALTKFMNRRGTKSAIDLMSISTLLQPRLYKTRFVVEIGTKMLVIMADEIGLFASIERATYLFSKEGKKYLIKESIEELSQQLNPSQFFQVNRKYIVALDAIDHVTSWSNSRKKIILNQIKLDDMIVVSRERVKDFKEWLSGSV